MRYAKEGLVKQAALFPAGEPEGGSLTGTFERTRECISGFFFLGPRGY
jgi:hypothetical protein